MSRLRVHITTSLDGYVAGPNQSEKEPLGEGGRELHNWAFALEAWRKPHGTEGGEANPSTQVDGITAALEQAVEAPGVTHLKYRVIK